MKNYALRFLPLLLFVLNPAPLWAHCQVPCGIYGDQQRFEQLLEDTDTIAKAITEIGGLAGSHDANGQNQLVRWVTTKENHATHLQNVVAEYFLAQRIKSSSDNYVEQLKAAHAVIVAAMKTKQAADPATAETLRAAIFDLYRAYTGKEPQEPKGAHRQLHAAPDHAQAALPVSHPLAARMSSVL